MHVALCSLPVCASQDDNSEVDEQEDEEKYHVGSKRADEEHESDDSEEQEEVGYLPELARCDKTSSYTAETYRDWLGSWQYLLLSRQQL